MSNDIADTSNVTDFEEELRKERWLQAKNHLIACQALRSEMGLPVEQLPLIDNLLREPLPMPMLKERPPSTLQRAPIRLVSEKKIRATDPRKDQPTAVIARPQIAAMRVEQIEILSNPDDWYIADILVGHRSQMPNSGPPIPGGLFTPDGTCYKFVTETIQVAMDFTMLVHYVGMYEEATFEALAMGSFAV